MINKIAIGLLFEDGLSSRMLRRAVEKILTNISEVLTASISRAIALMMKAVSTAFTLVTVET
jgi:hypothetical protein